MELVRGVNHVDMDVARIVVRVVCAHGFEVAGAARRQDLRLVNILISSDELLLGLLLIGIEGLKRVVLLHIGELTGRAQLNITFEGWTALLAVENI